jgi:hypothetical protein
MPEQYVSHQSDRPERFYASVVVAVIAACTGLLSLAVPYAWQWYINVGVGAVLIAAVVLAHRERRRVNQTMRRVALGVSIAITGLVGLGNATQLVLDGEPVLVTSDEARAHALVGEIYDDIMAMGVHDELLAISQPDARARYNDYEPAARDLRKIANRWARVDFGSLPDPDLIEILQHLKSGATSGAIALELRYQIIAEPDYRAEAAMNDARATFLSETVAAGAKLRPLAERYRVSLGGEGLE